MDSVRLNESPAKTHGRDTRAEDIRLKCLEIAVSGHGAGLNDPTIIRRAKAFEDFALHGLDASNDRPGQTLAYTPPQGGWPG